MTKTYKIYIVLHGQGIRASDESKDIGYVHTGDKDGIKHPNFFTVPENTKIFRMVPPGHVFMSHIDINTELRKFFAQPIEHWIGNFLSSTTLSINGYQASAIQDQGSVDPETQTNNRSRAIFNKMLQLFQSGDLITNERLETDFDSAESRNEFGIWITRSGKSWGQPIYLSTDPFFLNPITGEAKEIPMDIIVNRIRNRLGLNNNFEFYIANCSPVSQDFRSKHARLRRGENGKWSREGEYSTNANSINFWKNTFDMFVKRIRIYHNGKFRLQQFKDSQNRKRKRLMPFPEQDTVWGMMDDAERQDNYKLMNGFLTFYPLWLNRANTESDREKIIEDMRFYIKSISTPFTDIIRNGYSNQLGISQITRDEGLKKKKRNKKNKNKREKKKIYYTLSKELILKLRHKINLAVKNGDNYSKGILCDLIDYVYGQHTGETLAYPHSGREFIAECVDSKKEKKKKRKIVKTKRKHCVGPPRGARGRCSIMGGKRKTFKKRRRKIKKTRRRKSK